MNSSTFQVHFKCIQSTFGVRLDRALNALDIALAHSLNGQMLCNDSNAIRVRLSVFNIKKKF